MTTRRRIVALMADRPFLAGLVLTAAACLLGLLLARLAFEAGMASSSRDSALDQSTPRIWAIVADHPEVPPAGRGFVAAYRDEGEARRNAGWGESVYPYVPETIGSR